MSKSIRIDLDSIPYNGMDVVFRTPCDCSEITDIIIYHPKLDGTIGNQKFVLKDAHNNNIGNLSELFASDVLIKILLDITNGYAYIQNADTNQYLENKFGNHSHTISQLPTISVAKGGTGATNKKTAKQNLGIYYSATKPTNWADGDIWLQPL